MVVVLGKPKPQRTDCPSCGAVSQWLVDDGRVEVHGTDADEMERDSLGVCPQCGEDGVVFTTRWTRCPSGGSRSGTGSREDLDWEGSVAAWELDFLGDE